MLRVCLARPDVPTAEGIVSRVWATMDFIRATLATVGGIPILTKLSRSTKPTAAASANDTDFATVAEESAIKATAYFAAGGQQDQEIPVGDVDT